MSYINTTAKVIGLILIKPMLSIMAIIVIFAIMATLFWVTNLAIELLSLVFGSLR